MESMDLRTDHELTSTTALRRFPSASLAKLLPEQKKAARFSNRSSPMYKLFIGASMAFQTKGQTNRNAVNIDVYSHKIRE